MLIRRPTSVPSEAVGRLSSICVCRNEFDGFCLLLKMGERAVCGACHIRKSFLLLLGDLTAFQASDCSCAWRVAGGNRVFNVLVLEFDLLFGIFMVD